MIYLSLTHYAYSNSVGQYEISDVEQGSYVLTAERLGYETSITNITLQEDITRVDIVLVPTPTEKAVLHGTVTDTATGGALEGVLVALDAAYSGYTNSNGYYEITDIAFGSYILKFTKEGYNDTVFSVSLSQGIVTVDASLLAGVPPEADFYMPAEMTVYVTDGMILSMYWKCRFSVTITNNGSIVKTYSLAGHDNADAIGVTPRTWSGQITLAPGQSHTWSVEYNIDFDRFPAPYVWELFGGWEGDNYSKGEATPEMAVIVPAVEIGPVVWV